jgi:hypothetical protein
MSLLQSNATVNTLTNGVATLSGIAAYIGAPTPKDLQQFGGVCRFVVALDPLAVATNVQVGDDLQITAWGQFSPNAAKLYRVLSAEPAGSLGLEVYRLVIGDRIMR